MDDGVPDVTGSRTTPPHVAELHFKIGHFSARSRLSITTGGLLAVATLVGVILSGSAGIVWAATGPARLRARQGKSRNGAE